MRTAFINQLTEEAKNNDKIKLLVKGGISMDGKSKEIYFQIAF